MASASTMILRSMRMTGDKCMSNKDFNKASADVLAFLDELMGIGKEEQDSFPELEDASHEALVRIGKAHHRAPLQLTHQGED